MLDVFVLFMQSSETEPMKEHRTSKEQDVLNGAYLRALRIVPKFTENKDDMPLIAAIRRDVHMRFFPHMRDVYKQCHFDLHRLHFHEVGELNYVTTHDGDGRIWEIKGILWSQDGQVAPKAEIVADFGAPMTEEQLTEHLREQEIEDTGVDPYYAETL